MILAKYYTAMVESEKTDDSLEISSNNNNNNNDKIIEKHVFFFNPKVGF